MTGRAPTYTYFSSPGKLETHWRIDNYSSINNPANAVRYVSFSTLSLQYYHFLYAARKIYISKSFALLACT